jgi:uncharacterized membrane protein (UPF0127 family)
MELQTLQNESLNRMKSVLFLWTLLAFTVNAFGEGSPQLNLPRVSLSAGFYQIDAQVASTDAQTSTGLMFRRDMPAHEGMLFVFPQATKRCFWMLNTLLPLTAAFIADDGTIVNLENMQPQSTAPHCSSKPVRFVLEMNQGWFSKRGIKVGARITGAPFSSP